MFNSLTLEVLFTSSLEVIRLASAIHHVEPVEYLGLACSRCIEQEILALHILNQQSSLFS